MSYAELYCSFRNTTDVLGSKRSLSGQNDFQKLFWNKWMAEKKEKETKSKNPGTFRYICPLKASLPSLYLQTCDS